MYLDFMTDDETLEDSLDSINDLIRYLEKEKERLKKCMEKASEELEFSEAKAFAKAHRTIAGRLRALKNMRDPGYDERARHYRTLIFLEEQIKIYSTAPQLVKRFKEQLKETNQILDELEKKTYSPIDTQHIDDAIFELIEGTIESFKLHMNKTERMVFDFTCSDKLLEIGFSYKKRSLFRSIKKRLRKIGFLKVKGSRRFVRSVDVQNFRDAQPIKQLLAVVVFDVFGQSWFDRPAELEINYAPDSTR